MPRAIGLRSRPQTGRRIRSARQFTTLRTWPFTSYRAIYKTFQLCGARRDGSSLHSTCSPQTVHSRCSCGCSALMERGSLRQTPPFSSRLVESKSTLITDACDELGNDLGPQQTTIRLPPVFVEC